MIEVACSACGNLLRLAEADVPVGGKAVSCPSCKARVVIPAPAGVTDLPAPARPSRPASNDLTDLPAPRAPAGMGKPAVPATAPARPAPAAPPAAKGPPSIDLSDLPAPKGPPSISLSDLPAPKAPTPAPASATPGPGAGLGDLPAPKRASTPGVTDLPMPKRPAIPAAAGPAPTAPATPAPAGKGPPPVGVTDLPAPKGPSASPALGGKASPDLPMPKRPSVPAVPPASPAPVSGDGKRAGTVLGTPTGPAPAPILPPAPSRPATPSTAATAADALAAATPARRPSPLAGAEPAPARPVTTGLAAARGDDQLAPKGFFDDLPAPVGPSARGATDLPAPKGFFDDLPRPAEASSQSLADLPAPKGFFDDLPLPGAGGPTDVVDAAPPPPLDLDDLDLGLPSAGPAPTRAAGPGVAPTQLAARPATGPAPMLDLGDASAPLDLGLGGGPGPGGPAGEGGYDELDLPTAAPVIGAAVAGKASGVAFKPSSGSRTRASDPPPIASADAALELEGAPQARAAERKPAPRAAAAAEASPTAASPQARRRRLTLLLAAGLGVVAVGGGGFYGYTRWQAGVQRKEDYGRKLLEARAALSGDDAGHWKRAISAGTAAIELGGPTAEAVGVTAQAMLAASLDDGAGAAQRQAAAKALLARPRGASHVELTKAQALMALADGQADRAVERLAPLAKAAPNDANVNLYLGWAALAAGDAATAITAFSASAAALPKRDLPALFGRAQARIAVGDFAGASTDLGLVLERNRDHVGAQVALAMASPTPDYARRESDMLALLARKDIDQADPREVARAWRLAADDARRAGRFDAARDRYRKAQALAPLDLPAITGQAELEMQEGKLEPASELVERALKISATDVDANLAALDLELRSNKLAEAEARIGQLRGRVPPLTQPQQKARLAFLRGRWLEAQAGREEEAIAAYADAHPAGSFDLPAGLAAATLLGKMADKASTPTDAAALRKRADDVLAPAADQARKDAGLAVTLGVGYLSAGNPERAEQWLREALAARPADVEAQFQLGQALKGQRRMTEALASLARAFELDASRIDIGLELARSYEAAGRGADAGAMYDKLLAAPEVSIDLRGRAGRFFVRGGQLDKAGAQAEKILEADPQHSAGLYLQGVVLLDQVKKLEDARRALKAATAADPDPEYWTALGRACEQLATQSGDTRFKDEALRAYDEALTALGPDPAAAPAAAFAAHLGSGRLHIDARTYDKAVTALNAADKLRGGDGDVLYLLGLAHYELGHAKEATSFLVRAMAARPRADGYYRLALMYYAANQAGPAAGAYTQATKLGLADEAAGATVPWLTEALYNLGNLESSRSNDGAACRAWNQYLARNPTNQALINEVKRLMLGLRGC